MEGPEFGCGCRSDSRDKPGFSALRSSRFGSLQCAHDRR
jgi:hypothetical protein